MLMSRILRVPVAVAAVLAGVLVSAPAFAQAHIRGTVTEVKDIYFQGMNGVGRLQGFADVCQAAGNHPGIIATIGL